MDVRKKLIDLIIDAKRTDPETDSFTEYLADHLVAHGVTVQEWISVTERLPKLIPCSAGTAYSEAVNVLTSDRKVITAIWDGTEWIGSFGFWDADGEEITHWAPVLFPLPKPPKGE